MNHELGTFGTDPHMLHRTGDPDTSVDAAHAVDTTKLEAMVFNDIKKYGTVGCIQDDILALHKGYPYSSITARFRALLDKGLIEDTGERREGRSGRKQRVLREFVKLEWQEGNMSNGVMIPTAQAMQDIDPATFRRLNK